jgi:hypothetical protein
MPYSSGRTIRKIFRTGRCDGEVGSAPRSFGPGRPTVTTAITRQEKISGTAMDAVADPSQAIDIMWFRPWRSQFPGKTMSRPTASSSSVSQERTSEVTKPANIVISPPTGGAQTGQAAAATPPR